MVEARAAYRGQVWQDMDSGKTYKIREKQMYYTPIKDRKLDPFLSNGETMTAHVRMNGLPKPLPLFPSV